ncbi:MAG: OsmC family protein [Sphingobacteriaceae bacterium]|jgi:uncharacterized OsmC-like protein|nr:MAG: OsmC family peroxiredoxin [Pedobacter sp.]
MATIESTYLGELRSKSVHVQSGQKLLTDAPIDNQGKGESFSPTDLLATSLGNCMLTVMGIAAREHHLNIDGTTCSIVKVMATNPRRVSEIQIEFNFPKEITYSDKEKAILERSAITCPVAKSVHPDLIQQVKFNFT